MQIARILSFVLTALLGASSVFAQPEEVEPEEPGEGDTEGDDETSDDDGPDDEGDPDDVGDDAAVDEVVVPPPPKQDIDDLLRRLRETEDRLDKVENASDRQRLFWGGSYRTSVAGYRYRGPSPDGATDMMGRPIQIEDDNREQWLHRVRLDIRAEPLPNVRFTGRAVMFKRFGQNGATPFPQDQADTAIPRDTGLRLERAWLDWFITPNIALSAGRISYSDGPPAELKENFERPDATWGLHMVDGEFDTVDLTVELSDRFLARLFYASWAFQRQDDLFSENLFLNSGTENLRIYGGNFDIRTPELGNHFIQLGAYTVPKFRPFFIPIRFAPQPGQNPTNAPPPFDGSLVFPSSVPSSLGSYSNLSALMLWKDVAESGLDVFGAVAYGIIEPNDESISYNLPFAPDGSLVEVPFLALASAEVGGDSSLFLFAGARFTPKLGPRSPRLGFEFNRGSKYWFSFGSPKLNLINKLGNRGTAIEAYYIQPLNKALFMRLGFLHLQQDHGGSFFGPRDPMFGGTAPPTDKRIQAYELMLNATF